MDYDDAGRLTSLSVSSGTDAGGTTNYTYDVVGRLETVANPTTTSTSARWRTTP